MITDSILLTIKPLVNVEPDDTNFDIDIVTSINTALSLLSDIGVGPVGGLEIKDETTTWDELYVDPELNMVKTYVQNKIKLIFDPPTNSTVLKTLTDFTDELYWRINRKVEEMGGASV